MLASYLGSSRIRQATCRGGNKQTGLLARLGQQLSQEVVVVVLAVPQDRATLPSQVTHPPSLLATKVVPIMVPTMVPRLGTTVLTNRLSSLHPPISTITVLATIKAEIKAKIE